MMIEGHYAAISKSYLSLTIHSCFYQNIHHTNVLELSSVLSDIYGSFAWYASCNVMG